MESRKRRLKRSQLYLILDKKTRGNKPLGKIIASLKDSGIDIIQLRDKISAKEAVLKDAFALRKLLDETGILFIVNDYLDIAKISGADGIHLGQKDGSLKIAREIFGKDKIIGVSCHNLKQAQEAQKNGADYIGVGPVFATPTKPQYKAIGLAPLDDIRKKIKIPFFAIGGISRFNLKEVSLAGANRVALCRGLLNHDSVRSRKK